MDKIEILLTDEIKEKVRTELLKEDKTIQQLYQLLINVTYNTINTYGLCNENVLKAIEILKKY